MQYETTKPSNPFLHPTLHHLIKIGEGVNRPVYKEFFRELLIKYEYFAKKYGNKVFYWLLTSIEKELDYKYKRASNVIDYLCENLRIISTMPYKEARRINGHPLFDRRNSTKPRQKDDNTYFADTTKFYLFLWDKMVDEKFIEHITPSDAGKEEDIVKVRKMLKDYFLYLKNLPDQYEELKEQERQEQERQKEEEGQDRIPQPLQERLNNFRQEARRVFKEFVEDELIEEDWDELSRFIWYWTTPSQDGTKMRFEDEKFFKINFNMIRWFSNQNRFD